MMRAARRARPPSCRGGQCRGRRCSASPARPNRPPAAAGASRKSARSCARSRSRISAGDQRLILPCHRLAVEQPRGALPPDGRPCPRRRRVPAIASRPDKSRRPRLASSARDAVSSAAAISPPRARSRFASRAASRRSTPTAARARPSIVPPPMRRRRRGSTAAAVRRLRRWRPAGNGLRRAHPTAGICRELAGELDPAPQQSAACGSATAPSNIRSTARNIGAPARRHGHRGIIGEERATRLVKNPGLRYCCSAALCWEG